MSLPLKQWKTIDTDESVVLSLSRELNVPEAFARILVARGLTDPEAAESFLNPRLSDLSDPYELPGMNEAVARVWKAVNARQRVAVFGDYDVDGVTSTALMVMVLGAIGADVYPFLPDRMNDGYGMTLSPLKRCIDDLSPDLVITVDCGTNSIDAVQYAVGMGIDVVITDHHEPHGQIAKAVSVVNPKLRDGGPGWNLAGVGVAFKLCHALVKDGLKRQCPEVKNIDLRDWLDLVAIGTIADIVPIEGENRILVRHGLSRINSFKKRTGVRALMHNAGIDGTIDGYHIGFIIGPRINAAGRIGSAKPALDLLLTDDDKVADSLAAVLTDANNQRKQIEEKIKISAENQIKLSFDSNNCFGIVVGDYGWHVGINGIVASRLCSSYRMPVVVVAFNEDGKGTGSCRGIESINVLDILNDCSDLLNSYGGHKMAAGLEINISAMDDFRRRFNNACESRLRGTDLTSVQRVDTWVNLGDLDDRLFENVSKMSPHGIGNPVPVLGVKDVYLAGPPRKVGKNDEHVKMRVVSGVTQMEAIAFGMGKYELPEGKLDILFELKENDFRGRKMLQMNVRDICSYQ